MMVGNQQSISMSSPPSRKSNKRKHSHKHTSRFISGQSNVGHSVRGADENHESVTLTRPIQPRIETFFRAFSSNKDETTLSKTTTERTKNISNLHHPIVKPSKSHATKQSSRFFPYLHYKSRLEKDPLLFTGEGQSINEPNMLLSFHSRAFASGLAAIHNMVSLPASTCLRQVHMCL